MRIGRILGIAVGILLIVTLAAVIWIGANLEEFLNRVDPVALPGVSAQARRCTRRPSSPTCTPTP